MFNLKTILTVVVTFASFNAFAGNWQQNHPRRTEVNKRLGNQQKRVDNGLANGSLKPGQAEKIQNQDASIRRQEQRDASQNGGHITKQEQGQLNREENHVSNEINRDEGKTGGGGHPRIQEVNGRLNNQQNRVDNGLANGKLSTGQAEQIQNQDGRIKAQEQRDAAQNGGHITKQEQGQLNHEENHVSNEIKRDENGNPVPSGAVPAAPAAPVPGN